MMNIRRIRAIYIWPALITAASMACGVQDSSNEESVEQAATVACDLAIAPIPSVPINSERELIIRDLYVVEDGKTGDGDDESKDHCRTTWNSACPASLQGRWTFGWMMAAMAGTSDVTSPVARQFVRDWLKKWLTPQQPNPNSPPAQPRTGITETLITPWLLASNCLPDTLDTCPLDLKKAPFRLLAFVNRIDLPVIAGYSDGGEFRVVFGALGFKPNCDDCGANTASTLQATVILEYNLSRTGGNLKTWGDRLHALSSINLHGTNTVPPDTLSQTVMYRNKLQGITDMIVGPRAPSPLFINGSSISHVRTNEIAFDCNSRTEGTICGSSVADPGLAQWEFRQFKLGGVTGASGMPLVQDTVSQTPDTSANHTSTTVGTTSLDNLLINQRNVIITGDQAFSATDNLLGNVSQTPFGNDATIWEKGVLTSANTGGMTTSSRYLVRHLFGFGTCNGCHYAETANQLGVFHIAPRNAGSASVMSNFLSAPLTSTDNVNADSPYPVNDPTNPSANQFYYNEPWRRACEIRRILTGSTIPLTKQSGHVK